MRLSYYCFFILHQLMRRRAFLTLTLVIFTLVFFWLFFQLSFDLPKLTDGDNEKVVKRDLVTPPNYGPREATEKDGKKPTILPILPPEKVITVNLVNQPPPNRPQIIIPANMPFFPPQGGFQQISTQPVKSSTDNVAFLVIDDGSNTALNFINSARSSLQLISSKPVILPPGTTVGNTSTQTTPGPKARKVTYFLFASEKYEVPAMDDLVKINFEAENFTQKYHRNPCQIYSKFADKFDYFDEAKFDHVFSFDGRMRMVAPINLVDEMLSNLTAVTHPSFYSYSVANPRNLPYDRRSWSCAYVALGEEGFHGYSAGNLFGGETDQISKMCHKLARCHHSPPSEDDDEPEFHQLINYFFAKVAKPTRTLQPSFCFALSMPELPFHPQKIQLNDRLPNEFNNLAEGDIADERYFARREKLVQRIVMNIRENYFNKTGARLAMNRAYRLQFLAYRCDSGGHCGSFGGRIRGAASLLYLAIGSERVYNLQWVDPLDMAEHYLAANEHWYNVSHTLFDAELSQSSYKPRYIVGSDHNAYQLLSILNQWKMNEFRRTADVLLITTNLGKNLMDMIFRLSSFYAPLQTAIPTMPEFKVNINHGVYLSAAMRVIFGPKSEKFKMLLNNIVTDEPNWSEAVKIGLQIRTCRDQPTFNCRHLEPEKWKCFAEKALEIINNRLKTSTKQSFIVLVANDLEGDGRSEIVNVIKDIFTASEVASMVKVFSPTLPKEKTGANLLEWHLLTEMDWLVISPSAFGETASIYSMKPTYRINNLPESTCRFIWYNADLTKTDQI